MKPETLKKTLTSINEEFMAHRNSCKTCAGSGPGVCKRGCEILLAFNAVIQLEVERDRRNPDRHCSLCQGSGWRHAGSRNGNPAVIRCSCGGDYRKAVPVTDGKSAAAGDVA